MADEFFEKQDGTYHFAVEDGSIVIACRFNTRGMGHVFVAHAENDLGELVPFPFGAANPGEALRSVPCGNPEPSSRLCISIRVRPQLDKLTLTEAIDLLKQNGFTEDASLLIRDPG